MTRHIHGLALILLLGLATAIPAQEATAPATPAPATPDATAPATPETPATAETPATPETPAAPDALAIGTEVPTDGPGSIYVPDGGVFTDWELRCERTTDGKDPCTLFQLLRDEQGIGTAEIRVFSLPAGQQAVAGATILTPLETLLTEDLVIQFDAGKAKRYPFTWCVKIGCEARVGFTAEDLIAMKKGKRATITIVPARAPDQRVTLNLSLNGFTAGFEAVSKTPQ